MPTLAPPVRDERNALREFLAYQQSAFIALAYGLTDSPVGQLAWMVDKFKAWTWPAESLPEDVLGVERMLDHVSL